MVTFKELNDLTDNGLGHGQVAHMNSVKQDAIKERILSLGNILMIEFDLSSSEEVDELPDETVLPPEAEILYFQLKDLLGQ